MRTWPVPTFHTERIVLHPTVWEMSIKTISAADVGDFLALCG
jgi:hypothetical protein